VAGCPPAACRRADRDHLAVVDQRLEPASGAASPSLASCGKPASPTNADCGDPAAAKSPINAAIQLRECPLRPALRAAASEASVKAKVRQINFSAWGAAPLLKEDG
jgi:hypothetical protein